MVEEPFCIRPSSFDSHQQVDAFYDELHEAFTSGYRQLTVNLARVAFVRPEGVIALVTASRLWHKWTGNGIVLVKMQSRVHRYLERIDLFSGCAAWLAQDHELPVMDRWDRRSESVSLLELLRIAGDEKQNAQDVGSAVGRANHILRTWFDVHDDAIGRVMTLISEISSNVTHSFDQGFALIQRYRSHTSARLGSSVIVAIADLGIGIQASLKDKTQDLRLHDSRPLRTGSDFILRALDLGVTRRAEIGGLGLSRVKMIVEEWQGSLFIRSFSSRVLFANNRMYVWDDLVEVPGTQVIITVGEGLGF